MKIHWPSLGISIIANALCLAAGIGFLRLSGAEVTRLGLQVGAATFILLAYPIYWWTKRSLFA
jgi:hypothetical protein